MEELNLDERLIRKLAEELASEDLGGGDSIEKRLSIDGTVLYALSYSNYPPCEMPGIKETVALDWADRKQIHAAVAYAAYEHFRADMDWAWDHFSERSEVCDIDDCYQFAAANQGDGTFECTGRRDK